MTPAAIESLKRLSPTLRKAFKKKEWRQFERQLTDNFERLFRLVHGLYGWRYDFAWILADIVNTTVDGFASRPKELRREDRSRPPQSWVTDPTCVWATVNTQQLAGKSKPTRTLLKDWGVTHIQVLAGRSSDLAVPALTQSRLPLVLDLARDRPVNGHDPAVLAKLCKEIIRLANFGAAAIRLESGSFVRTPPDVWPDDLDIHLTLQLIRVMADIAAPTSELVLEAESGHGPRFVNPRECRLGSDDQLNGALWEALATADTNRLRVALANRLPPPEGCTWLTYLRPPPASTLASTSTLAGHLGLEEAVERIDPVAIDLAVRRTLAVYSVALGLDGIPVLPLHDPIANLNDEISQGLRRLLEVRRSLPGTLGSPEVLDPGDHRVVAFRRGSLIVAANLSSDPAVIDRTSFGNINYLDLIGEDEWAGHILGPYEFRWLSG